MRQRTPTALKVRDFRSAERALKIGARPSARTIADAIERCPGLALPPLLRRYVAGLLRGKRGLPRGPGRKDDGFIWDFIVAEAKDMYSEKRAKFRAEDKEKRAAAKAAGDKLPRAEEAAHERAASHVLRKLQSELGIKNVKTLLNVLSARMTCEVPETDEIPPDEHDPPDHLPANRGRRKIARKNQ